MTWAWLLLRVWNVCRRGGASACRAVTNDCGRHSMARRSGLQKRSAKVGAAPSLELPKRPQAAPSGPKPGTQPPALVAGPHRKHHTCMECYPPPPGASTCPSARLPPSQSYCPACPVCGAPGNRTNLLIQGLLFCPPPPPPPHPARAPPRCSPCLVTGTKPCRLVFIPHTDQLLPPPLLCCAQVS